MRGRDHRDPPRRGAHCFFSFCKLGGCCWYRPLLLLPPGVKVQEEVQPLPSFLRSERTEPGAAAPPLRRHACLAWGRAHPAAATHSLRPPPSPGSKTRPTPPLPCAPPAAFAFAFCFLCSGAPAPARALQGTQRAPPAGPGKASERALALARRTPPPSCARARLLAARRRRLAGGRGGGGCVCRRGAPLRWFTPWKVDREREPGRRRASAAPGSAGGGVAMWGAVHRWV